jgi:crossover junction endodeoxyribonuclease RusA
VTSEAGAYQPASIHPGTAKVSLPWPPSQLTPNAKRRTHWRVYQPISKKYRADCCILTKAARVRGLMLSVTFCPPDRRKRDDDGMIGAFKAGRDGVADALGCDDHGFRPSYHFADPVKGGAVIIEIGEAF